jgi:hypothetical protein
MYKTIVYIDGLNLFYGALKNTPYKWLDIYKLCSELLVQNEIIKIKYFTANVISQPDDPYRTTRQEIYLRALRTFPKIEIILGKFHTKVKDMVLADSVSTKPQYVKVIQSVEKRTDVNLASHLLNDAHSKMFEVAAVVTNDSDLVEPIRIVHQELHLSIGLINPHKNTSQVLLSNANFVRQIRADKLANCQLPEYMRDEVGEFHKPVSW